MLNGSSELKEEFNVCYDNVYKEINNKKDASINKFRHSLYEYAMTKLEEEQLDFGKRKEMFLNVVESSGLDGVDRDAYSLFMKKKFFDEQELEQKRVQVSILTNNNPTDTTKISTSSIVFSFAKEDDNEKYDYYVMDDDGEVKEIEKDRLENKIRNGTYEWVYSHIIPGLNQNKQEVSIQRKM